MISFPFVWYFVVSRNLLKPFRSVYDTRIYEVTDHPLLEHRPFSRFIAVDPHGKWRFGGEP